MMTLPTDGELPATSPLHVYLGVLRRRWLLIISVFILTVTSGVLFAALQTPIYQAAATVLIDPSPPKIVNIPEVANDAEGVSGAAGSADYYATQYKLLQSRPVVEKVIE